MPTVTLVGETATKTAKTAKTAKRTIEAEVIEAEVIEPPQKKPKLCAIEEIEVIELSDDEEVGEEEDHVIVVDDAEALLWHPPSWSKVTHHGGCGQSCPCCRGLNRDLFGACPVCAQQAARNSEELARDNAAIQAMQRADEADELARATAAFDAMQAAHGAAHGAAHAAARDAEEVASVEAMQRADEAVALALETAAFDAMQADHAAAQDAQDLAQALAAIQAMEAVEAAQAAAQVPALPLAGPEVAAIETAEAPSTVRPLGPLRNGPLRKSARKPVSSAIHKGL
jgi:hypothetical protein